MIDADDVKSAELLRVSAEYLASLEAQSPLAPLERVLLDAIKSESIRSVWWHGCQEQGGPPTGYYATTNAGRSIRLPMQPQ